MRIVPATYSKPLICGVRVQDDSHEQDPHPACEAGWVVNSFSNSPENSHCLYGLQLK